MTECGQGRPQLLTFFLMNKTVIMFWRTPPASSPPLFTTFFSQEKMLIIIKIKDDPLQNALSIDLLQMYHVSGKGKNISSPSVISVFLCPLFLAWWDNAVPKIFRQNFKLQNSKMTRRLGAFSLKRSPGYIAFLGVSAPPSLTKPYRTVNEKCANAQAFLL